MRELSASLAGALRGGTSAVLATVSRDGRVSTALLSWLVATDENTVAAALDVRGAAYANISAGSDHIALEVLADDLILSVRGKAAIAQERMTSPPFACALVRVAVSEIRDHTIAHLRFHGPRYHWVDPKGHRSNVEQAIFKELAGAASSPD